MKNLSVFTIIMLVVLLIFVGPAFTIIALNTLLGLNIELTLGTWLSALWLGIVVRGTTYTSNK